MRHAGVTSPSRLTLTFKCQHWPNALADNFGFSYSTISELNEWYTGNNFVKETPAMREGTHAHILFERSIRNEYDDSGLKLSPKSKENVYMALDALNSIWVKKLPGSKIETEKLCKYNYEIWGHTDIRIWVPEQKILAIFDFKNGSWAGVNAVNNIQLAAYWMGSPQARMAKQAVLGILQPSHPDPAKAVQVWEPHPYDVWELMQEVEKRVALILERVPANPGTHCDSHFCPARDYCSAYKEMTSSAEDISSDVIAEYTRAIAGMK